MEQGQKETQGTQQAHPWPQRSGVYINTHSTLRTFTPSFQKHFLFISQPTAQQFIIVTVASVLGVKLQVVHDYNIV